MDSIASVTMATGGHYTCSNRHAACWLHHMIFFALQILCWMMLRNPSTIKRDLELQSTILPHNVNPGPFHCPCIWYNSEQQWTLTGKVWEASADEHQNDFQLLVQPCYSLLVDSAILQQHIVDHVYPPGIGLGVDHSWPSHFQLNLGGFLFLYWSHLN